MTSINHFQVDVIFENIGKVIKEERDIQNLTQPELAEKAGTTKTTILCIEKYNRRYRLDTIIRIMLALKIEPNKLFGYNKKKKQEA